MNCTACGLENGPGARFCARCGRELRQACPACGSVVEPHASFCPSCGTWLGATEPTTEAAESGEERKFVTVLFLDIVGFTSRVEMLDPEDVRRLFAPFYDRVRAELERFGGSVEKFIGDAVMALFGVPVAHEDDPERAVRAALAIRDVVEELNEDDATFDLHVRMAVNTGEAFVALGASPERGEWTVAGDVVNTCARMQTAAPTDGILVGETTYEITRDAIEYRRAEPVQAKGKAAPILVWEALAAREPVGGLQIERDVPLVGRTEELRLLLDTLERVHDESSPQLLTLVGVPGIGKSRLVLELHAASKADSGAVTWLQGRSLAYGEGVTFAALAEMLKSHAGILESDGAETAGEKLRAAVAALGLEPGEARRVERHLAPVVGLAGESDAPSDRRGESFGAWRRYFEALAERQPTVLVFEDIHWADDDLLSFVDYLSEWVVDLPLLVLTTTRPELLERRPDWGGGKRNAVTISLAALADSETARLIGDQLEGSAIPAETLTELLDRASGNPLYAAEYVRMLVDRGFIQRGGDGAADGLVAETLPVPATVHGIIAARLDSLPPGAKSLLHDAAVVGEVCWVGALAAVGSISRDTAEARLRALERREFVRRERVSSVAGEHQFTFRHALVRDVAYGQIARARRAEKHLAAAEWIESLAADRSENQAEMLAHHYVQALEFARASGEAAAMLADRAGRVLRDAGDHAFGLNAYVRATSFYAAALERLSPEDPSHAEVLFRYGRARYHAEQEGEEELTAARDALLAQENSERAAEVEVLLHVLYTTRGRGDKARERLEAAERLVEGTRASRSKASVLTSASRFLLLAGDSEGAIRVGREALAMADELELDELRAYALNNVGVARVMVGDLDGADDLERSIAIAEEIGSPESVRGYRFLASRHLMLGDLGESGRLLAAARREAERYGDAFNRRWLQAAGSLESYWQGDWDEALARADAFVTATRDASPHYMEAVCRRVQGLIHLARGDVAAAAADAERSLEFARISRDPWWFRPSLSFAARALLAQGRDDEAATCVDELLEIWRSRRPALISYEAVDGAVAAVSLGREAAVLEATRGIERPTRWLEAARALVEGDHRRAAVLFVEIGARPEEADARLRAAKSLLAAGNVEPADAELEAAVGFYRSVGAHAYVAEAEALLSVGR